MHTCIHTDIHAYVHTLLGDSVPIPLLSVVHVVVVRLVCYVISSAYMKKDVFLSLMLQLGRFVFCHHDSSSSQEIGEE